jgi:hypothetical protein
MAYIVHGIFENWMLRRAFIGCLPWRKFGSRTKIDPLETF